MRRALLVVLDSVGVGGAPDAADYGDAGADTLGHIVAQVPSLRLPTLRRLGLEAIRAPGDPSAHALAHAMHGRMREVSTGKDTTTGHWEIAGVISSRPFTTFRAFPAGLVRAIEAEAGVSFIGNYPQSGTVILGELGVEHVRTGSPILYTSADSVLQIAAHESVVPIDRLYEICRVARRHCDAHRIARVIARPFTGEPGGFQRTPRRHDFSMHPPHTVLNALDEAGIPVIGVGKISDIFAGSGIGESYPTGSNREGMDTIDRLWNDQQSGLVFANLVDFDMLHGHRRDPAGYARALEEFDAWLHGFLPRISPDELVIFTADHGNDPTWPGTDHTREEVPLIALHQGRRDPLGLRSTFADIAATLAVHFGLPPWPHGTAFLGASDSRPDPDRPPSVRPGG